MSAILVTPLSAVHETLRRFRPSHLITLLSPEFMIETPVGFPPERHLRLSLNDIVEPEPGRTPPHEAHIAQILEFSRGWDASSPMLVHCWAGVSRSMASAFSILCDRAPRGSEASIAQEIRARAPHANPNRLIVRLADAYLERDGEMMRAVDKMDAAVFVEEGVLVEFPLTAFGL
jgi:predicted protein tyrosine phosphatase